MKNCKVFSPYEEKFFGDLDDGTECILKFTHGIKPGGVADTPGLLDFSARMAWQ